MLKLRKGKNRRRRNLANNANQKDKRGMNYF